MFLTKEESRVSLVGIGAALCGSFIGAGAGVWGTYAKFIQDKSVQQEANRRQAYVQLKGQQAEFLLLFQQLAKAHDKNIFYQVSAVVQDNKSANVRRSAQQTKGINDRERYLSDALQQERNAERYEDRLVTCAEKMFESIGLIQLSFLQDEELKERIAAAESMLTRTDDVFPSESLRSRLTWATTPDGEQQMSVREKQRMTVSVRATAELTEARE